MLSQEQDDGCYHLVAYASRGLKGGELKYHSSKLEFLALKWAMTEQFREYLQYQPFPYICGSENKVADALSHVGGHLDKDDVKELFDQSTIKELLSHAVHYGMPRAESDDPRVTQEHEKAEGEIIMQA